MVYTSVNHGKLWLSLLLSMPVQLTSIVLMKLVVGSLLSPRGFFPSTPVFPSPQKPIIPNSNSTRNQVDGEPLCGCATPKSFFVLFIIY